MQVFFNLLMFVKISFAYNCDIKKASEYFNATELVNDNFDDSFNPYKTLNDQDKQKIEKVIENQEKVCALKFIDKNNQKYQLQNFESKKEAEQNGYFVTHYGVCGFCSNLKDLSIYLTKDLTSPAKKCAALTFISESLSIQCYQQYIGFSKKCAKIWTYNSSNTRRQCLSICLWITLTRQPDYKDGKLNKCILCDEEQSGRSRRNSGIESELPRPDEQIRPVDHCLYYPEQKYIKYDQFIDFVQRCPKHLYKIVIQMLLSVIYLG